MALRVSLLVIGGIIVLLIYLVSRRALAKDEPRFRRQQPWSAWWQRLRDAWPRDKTADYIQTQEAPIPTAPVLDPGELDKLEAIIPERGNTALHAEESPVIVELGSEQIAPAGEQLFIPLTIMGKDGRLISGDAIAAATQEAGMVLKEDGIYRYQVKDGQGYQQALLGLANILEPGTFDPEQFDQFTTPGLVLYLHLPAPIEAREAFDSLIDIGHQLEALLQAELCDETRSVLTKQTIGHLQEKVEAFRFKQKMTQVQRRRL